MERCYAKQQFAQPLKQKMREKKEKHGRGHLYCLNVRVRIRVKDTVTDTVTDRINILTLQSKSVKALDRFSLARTFISEYAFTHSESCPVISAISSSNFCHIICTLSLDNTDNSSLKLITIS